MPKIFGREVPSIMLVAGGLVAGYLVVTALFPAEVAAPTTKKPKAIAKKTVGETDYLLTDYTFKIDSLPDSVKPKDAFKPLVMKSQNLPNGILTIDNYTYSGMASIDGVANGLLENAATGQGDFVKKGQRWHDSWLVVSIDADKIAMKNDVGDITTLLAGAASLKSTPGTSGTLPSPGGSNPVMVGPIGAQDLSLVPDSTAMAQQGNGGRRGRGGRGGGRGGRGGGGAPMDGG